MNKAPKTLVTERFESRENLVGELLTMLGDAADDGTASRLRGARNAQLLRLHAVLTEVKDRFGSKGDLVSAIAEKKFGSKKVDPRYVEKINGFTAKKLLDLYAQVS